MAIPFLSSEEYDERAHREYDEGEYDAALETLQEGLALYPNSVELHIGLAYTRVAREEFAWARRSFESALVLDPEHEDALVGLGEALLRFGERAGALAAFRRARETGSGEDLDLLLSIGRALYREGLYEESRVIFEEAIRLHPTSADVAGALGFALYRLGEQDAALRQLRRALHLDREHTESRIFLGHALFDRGELPAALREFERVAPGEHWDVLALSRLIELKTTIGGVAAGSPELVCWEARLAELEGETDATDLLLAEIEDSFGGALTGEPASAQEGRPVHRVALPDGMLCSGSWLEIVRQIRDARGQPAESVAQFMRRRSVEERARSGVSLPADDPREFVMAGARAGHWRVDY
jgi:cytochrome c-type biogenesis protein CcmH/NrfG